MSRLPFLDGLKAWAARLKRDVLALWLAARDPHVPWVPKLLAVVVAAYALSPVDLIPDFVPVLGYVDDLLLVPAGIWLTVTLIPAPLMAELRARARDHGTPRSMAGLMIVAAIWAGAILLAWSLS